MTLDSALRFLAEIHTGDDDFDGFQVKLGAYPDIFDQDRHRQAWKVVRQHLGLPTTPTLDKAG